MVPLIHPIRDFIDIPSLIIREMHADNVVFNNGPECVKTAISDGYRIPYDKCPIRLQTDWIKLNPNMVIFAKEGYRLNVNIPDSPSERALAEAAIKKLEEVKAAYQKTINYRLVTEEKDVQVAEKHWFRKDTVKTVKQTVQVSKAFTKKLIECKIDTGRYHYQFDRFVGKDDHSVNVSIDGDYKTLEQFFESINKHEQYRITYEVNTFVHRISDDRLVGHYHRFIERIERRSTPTDSVLSDPPPSYTE